MGLFDTVGDFFGSSTGGGQPKYQAADLDQGTKDILDATKAKAGRSNDAFAQDITQGTDRAKNGLMSDSQMGRQNAALGMQDDASMRQAIQGRAQRAFDTSQANIKASANAEAPLQKFNLTNAAMGDYMQMQSNFNHNIMAQNQAKQNQLLARNNAIASVFAGVSKLGGTMLAPKPNSTIGSENSNFSGGYSGPDAAGAADSGGAGGLNSGGGAAKLIGMLA